MNPNKRQLMRLLHGELTPTEAARLEAVIERDDALRTTYEQLAATWQRLELAEPQLPPIDFATAIKAAARQERDYELSWARAPMWARTGAAVALTAGMTLGLVLGSDLNETLAPETLAPKTLAALGNRTTLADTAAMEDMAQDDFDLDPLSLAEIYWLSIDDQEQLFSDPATGVTGSPGSTDSSGGIVR